jgi:hypothetical protein
VPVLGDLAADMARFAHAGHHDPTPAIQADPAGARKIRSEAGQLGAKPVDLDHQGLTAEVDQGFVREVERRLLEVHPPIIPRMQASHRR